MARHVVSRVADIPVGASKVVSVRGRPIAVFNVGGEFFAVLDRCPHEGASLSCGARVGLVQSDEPGRFSFSRPGEFVRCPWHGWEYDLESGEFMGNRRWKLRKFETERRGDDVYLLA